MRNLMVSLLAAAVLTACGGGGTQNVQPANVLSSCPSPAPGDAFGYSIGVTELPAGSTVAGGVNVSRAAAVVTVCTRLSFVAPTGAAFSVTATIYRDWGLPAEAVVATFVALDQASGAGSRQFAAQAEDSAAAAGNYRLVLTVTPSTAADGASVTSSETLVSVH